MTKESTSSAHRYVIERITLRIAKTPSHMGRVECFTNSLKLLRRLDVIGKRRLVILAAYENGVPFSELQVDSLNHYLHACLGLRCFRRSYHLSNERYAWLQLRTLAGITAPHEAHKSANKVPA